MHPTDLEIQSLLEQCEVRRVKRSGPGGQHRNKTASAVVLKHLPTGIIAEANERRDQSVNQQRALFRLRVQLALEIRSRRDDAPSAVWKSRCRNGRIALDPSHDDYPRMLAEALDILVQHDHDVRSAADRLGCSPSQLIRILSMDPRAMALLNAGRKTRGLKPLRPKAGN